MNHQELIQKLQAPFPADDYEWRVQQESKDGSKVNVLCYVTARAIQNRLDELFGPFGWYPSYRSGADKGVICALSIKDPDSDTWITKEDGAENTNIEAVKGGISGALKRAAVVWGIGRHLYQLESVWVPLQTQGQHYHKVKNGQNKDKFMYWNPPQLPNWAVAGNGVSQKKPANQNSQSQNHTGNPPEAPTRRQVFWVAFKKRCSVCDIQVPTEKHIFEAVLIELCSTKLAADASLEYEWDMPIPNMDENSTGWQVLEKVITNYDLKGSILRAITNSKAA